MEIKNFTITKRDGSKDLFSLDKIMNAIVKAFESVQEPADLAIVSKILNHLDMHDNITVEDIHNQVEEALMREGYYKVAKSFILYRQLHSEDRETLEKMVFLSEYCLIVTSTSWLIQGINNLLKVISYNLINGTLLQTQVSLVL